ncbi:MAG: YegS/Rv2252/BmrU family lipid kinase [Bacteroidetes bacterium HLUCCA01]|nr:MAG: YegS/Rv2252/BmrU family lipid kinase [Bacteroidetes bacterium HLUCCA01]
MQVFQNQEENRIRSPWRIVLFMAFAILLLITITAFVPFGAASAVVISLASTALLYLFGRYVDKRRFSGYGLQPDAIWWKELGIGVLLGGGTIAILFIISLNLSLYQVTGYGWVGNPGFWAGWLGYLIMMAGVGYYEELLFRGYLNLNLYEGLRGKRLKGAFWPAALSILAISVLFGLVHAGNPNATLLGIINVTLAGVMLGVPFLATGRLAMPIGIHFAWNFVQGGVVGVPVSGLAATNSLLITHSIHEDILAGGAFGFEGGLLGTVGILAILTGSVAWIVHLRKACRDQQMKSTGTDFGR